MHGEGHCFVSNACTTIASYFDLYRNAGQASPLYQLSRVYTIPQLAPAVQPVPSLGSQAKVSTNKFLVHRIKQESEALHAISTVLVDYLSVAGIVEHGYAPDQAFRTSPFKRPSALHRQRTGGLRHSPTSPQDLLEMERGCRGAVGCRRVIPTSDISRPSLAFLVSFTVCEPLG